MFLLVREEDRADGGPPQDGVFYEVAGAGIVHFENVSQSMY